MRVISRGIWNVLIENTRNRRWHWDTRPHPQSVRTRDVHPVTSWSNFLGLMGYQLSLPMLLRTLKLRCDYLHKLTLPFKNEQFLTSHPKWRVPFEDRPIRPASSHKWKTSYDFHNPPALAFLISTFMGSQKLKFERGTKKEEQFLVVADQCRSPQNFSLGRPNQMLTFEFGGGEGKQENPRTNNRSRIESKQKVWRQVRHRTRAILMEGKFYNTEPFRVWDSTRKGKVWIQFESQICLPFKK